MQATAKNLELELVRGTVVLPTIDLLKGMGFRVDRCQSGSVSAGLFLQHSLI